jgi:hypothetical protein
MEQEVILWLEAHRRRPTECSNPTNAAQILEARVACTLRHLRNRIKTPTHVSETTVRELDRVSDASGCMLSDQDCLPT